MKRHTILGVALLLITSSCIIDDMYNMHQLNHGFFLAHHEFADGISLFHSDRDGKPTVVFVEGDIVEACGNETLLLVHQRYIKPYTESYFLVELTTDRNSWDMDSLSKQQYQQTLRTMPITYRYNFNQTHKKISVDLIQ